MSDNKYFVIENGVLKKYWGREEDVVIPDGITSIGKSAFDGYHRLMNITIPETVTSIGYWDFRRTGFMISV